MLKLTFKITLALILTWLSAIFLYAGPAYAAPGAIPRDMVGDPVPENAAINTLGQWFTALTTGDIHSTYFASWVTQALGSKLYIGLSAARPGEWNWGLLAEFDGERIRSISPLTDQGVSEFGFYQNLLHIGGADAIDAPPPGGHQWDGGNFYTYNTTTDVFTKYRCTLSGGVCVTGTYVLPNVIHVLGEYVAADGTIFVATGSDDGSHPGTCTNGVDCFGEIHKSTDHGATWTRSARFATADPVNPITSYRIYDVAGFNNKLYATYVAEYDMQGFLAESSDNGVTWTNVAAMPSLHNRSRLFVYQNKLFGMSYDRTKVYGMDTAGNITTYNLGFTAGPGVVTEYNIFAQDTRGNLYTISSTGKLKVTSNLTSWIDYSDLGVVAGSNNFASVSYWESRDSIIVSGMGTNAKLWIVDVSPPPLSNAGGNSCVSKVITAPVLLSPSLTGSAGEVTLSWQSVPGASAYNIFYGTKPGSYPYSLVGVKGDGLVTTKIGKLTSGSTYYFAVVATDGCSVSPYSNVRSMHIGGTSLTQSGESLIPQTQAPLPNLNRETGTIGRGAPGEEKPPASLMPKLWALILWLIDKLRRMVQNLIS